MTDTTNTNVQTTAVKLTGREALVAKQIKAYNAYTKAAEVLTAVNGEIANYDALSAIGVGSSVVITIGKGDAAKDVSAVVIAAREDEAGGKTFKVTYGEGFDADVATVPAGKIKLPATVQDVPPGEQPVEQNLPA